MTTPIAPSHDRSRSSDLDARLSRLERTNRRWRTACLGGLVIAIAGALIAQTSGLTIQPTILCRGIKVFDPQGRKRGEFVMANGTMALRIFDENGNALANMGQGALTFSGTTGPRIAALSLQGGVRVGDPDSVQGVLGPSGLALFDSSHECRAMLSLSNVPHFGPPIDAESGSLVLYRPNGSGYELFPHGTSIFAP